MTDNSVIPVSVGTETFANNDIGGVKYPRVKMVWGVAGAANDASATNPLPVVTQGSINIGTMPAISGTVTATISGTPAVTIPAVVQGAGGASAWKVDGSAVTQPVSNATQLPAALGAHGAMKVEGVASGTLIPVTVDPSQIAPLVNGGVPVTPAGLMYSIVGASTADFRFENSLGSQAPGSLLDHLVCTVTDPTTCEVRLADGTPPGGSGGAIVLPANPTGGVGVYHILLGGDSAIGAWRLSTGAGVSLIMFGIHT